jgi:hypothetical protein
MASTDKSAVYKPEIYALVFGFDVDYIILNILNKQSCLTEFE